MTENPPARRTPPPPLEPAMPDCSVCGEITDFYDEAYRCDSCGAAWRPEDAYRDQGRWCDPDTTQCPSEIRPWPNDSRPAVRDAAFRCLHTEGHKGMHIDPYGVAYEWTDDDIARKDGAA
ncbi:hypothetical protein GCM10012275_64880 [Longimycelium tulufanense]|uniref:Uncharacterized protein n=1 Tax=Longimycelium tulufanense TaxID=907463 RepID=A0A8J3FYW1_9PSEU|nr:hypothetical protein [Longimycelium tulufanense]GGM85160.1 hypothetical protein GCM10012275_64880 [Longimycelium tulufanense]